MPGLIGIVSLELDLHAHAVAKRLRERFYCGAHVIAVDEAHLSCRLAAGLDGNYVITDYADQLCTIKELDVLWWRRANQPQKNTSLLQGEHVHDFVSREWRFSFQSVFLDGFRGVWVNEPWCDIRASSRHSQLSVAQEIGFNVPDTIVTNVYSTVLAFWEKHAGRVVLKKVAGSFSKPLATVRLEGHNLVKENIELCPAIYQELIPAELHLRVVCFGDDVHVIAIESDVLDWRRNINQKMFPIDMGDEFDAMVVSYLRALGLRMGVLDLILSESGAVYFLEVNPQGQFLFAEQRAGIDLTNACAAFLAAQASSRREQQKGRLVGGEEG